MLETWQDNIAVSSEYSSGEVGAWGQRGAERRAENVLPAPRLNMTGTPIKHDRRGSLEPGTWGASAPPFSASPTASIVWSLPRTGSGLKSRGTDAFRGAPETGPNSHEAYAELDQKMLKRRARGWQTQGLGPSRSPPRPLELPGDGGGGFRHIYLRFILFWGLVFR